MSKYKEKPLLPGGFATKPLRSRMSRVNINDFAQICTPDKSFSKFFESLPNILSGKNFKEFIVSLKRAKERNKGVIFGLGAHVVKVGLNPVIIDLMKRKWITALALNGAVIVHDFEIAFSGQTSEDVDAQIKNSQFGTARETGEMLNNAIAIDDEEVGLGEAVGKMISSSDFPYKRFSLLSAAYDLNIPVTVHVAIGTDFIHFHPKVNGEALGKASLRDFFLFCSLVEQLEGGGVFINVGSAVILPEVFLKAISFVRNRGKRLEEFYTAVFDFMHHYRPYQNVVKRPLGKRGKGFYFIGHHEIMIPLLAASLKTEGSK